MAYSGVRKNGTQYERPTKKNDATYALYPNFLSAENSKQTPRWSLRGRVQGEANVAYNEDRKRDERYHSRCPTEADLREQLLKDDRVDDSTCS
jgi:hypothetical protein